jgi:multidrug efflux pump
VAEGRWAAINAGGNLLPADLPMPPIYSKVNRRRAGADDCGHFAVTAGDQAARSDREPAGAEAPQVDGVGLSVSPVAGARSALPMANAASSACRSTMRSAIVAANQAKGS